MMTNKTLNKFRQVISLGLLLSARCILSAQTAKTGEPLNPGLAKEALSCPASVPISADHTVSLLDFGATPNQGPALDVAPYLNCALSFTQSHGLRAIYIPAGWYYFDSPVRAINFQITIFGDGKGRTYLDRNYVASSAAQGMLTFLNGANSASVRDLGIVATAGSLHGSAISLVADQNDGPDFMLLSNLYLSAGPGGNWDYTVYINGTARTQAPIGVRDTDFQNCSVFGAAQGAILLDGVVGFNFFGGGIFRAGGMPTATGLVAISPSFNGIMGIPS